MPLDPSAPQPLGLTVHSLPRPEAPPAQRTRLGRWKMLAVLLVCAAPVVASYFSYYVIRPQGSSSYGTLIAQQPSMPQLQAQQLDGSAVPLTSLQGQWLLVSVAGGACNVACEAHLYLQRQLRESLGREKERVDWLWLVSDAATPAPALQPALAQAQVLRLPQEQIQTWLQPAEGQALEDHLYLVNPQGHWMLRWPASLDQASAGHAKRDLDRLLRASASWDKPGR